MTDWQIIKDDFVINGLTQRELAQKHNVKPSAISRRCREEKWVSQRKLQTPVKIEQEEQGGRSVPFLPEDSELEGIARRNRASAVKSANYYEDKKRVQQPDAGAIKTQKLSIVDKNIRFWFNKNHKR